MTALPQTCSLPNCHLPVVATNRAGQPVCREHVAVVVSGAWVPKGEK